MLHSGQIYPLMSRPPGRPGRGAKFKEGKDLIREGKDPGGRGSCRATCNSASRECGPGIALEGQAIRPEEFPMTGTRTATMRPPGTSAQRVFHPSTMTEDHASELQSHDNLVCRII